MSGVYQGDEPLDLRPFFPGWLNEAITGGCYAVTTPMRDAPKHLAVSSMVPQSRRGEAVDDKCKRECGEKNMTLKAGRRAGELCFMAVDSAPGPAMVIESPGRKVTAENSLIVIAPRPTRPEMLLKYNG